MKCLFALAFAVVALAGCTSSRQYSSISEPTSGPRAFDPIVSAPRNWNKPVKSNTTARVEADGVGRVVPGTSWERSWHGE